MGKTIILAEFSLRYQLNKLEWHFSAKFWWFIISLEQEWGENLVYYAKIFLKWLHSWSQHSLVITLVEEWKFVVNQAAQLTEIIHAGIIYLENKLDKKENARIQVKLKSEYGPSMAISHIFPLLIRYSKFWSISLTFDLNFDLIINLNTTSALWISNQFKQNKTASAWLLEGGGEYHPFLLNQKKKKSGWDTFGVF